MISKKLKRNWALKMVKQYKVMGCFLCVGLAVLVMCLQSDQVPSNQGNHVLSSETVEPLAEMSRTAESDDRELGTTVIVSGEKTLEEWQPLVIEKVMSEYQLPSTSQFEFDYESLQESPMGSFTYGVTVGKVAYGVKVPGPKGFLFDLNGNAIEAGESLTTEEWLYNIAIFEVD